MTILQSIEYTRTIYTFNKVLSILRITFWLEEVCPIQSYSRYLNNVSCSVFNVPLVPVKSEIKYFLLWTCTLRRSFTTWVRNNRTTNDGSHGRKLVLGVGVRSEGNRNRVPRFFSERNNWWTNETNQNYGRHREK